MEYKPWPLLILAFFHFIEPFSKLTFYSVFFAMNPIDIILIEITEGSAIHIFEYFFLFPIAGVAIYAVKKWSMPVFLAVEVWAFVSNIPYIEELFNSQQYLLFAFFIIFAFLNVAVVSYFLIPAVRVAYMDPKIRWWEAKPRYKIDTQCTINNQKVAVIHNISESGVFIASQEGLEINGEIKLQFKPVDAVDKSDQKELNIKAELVHHFTIDGLPGYGAKFIWPSKASKRVMRKYIRSFELSNIQRRPPRLTLKNFYAWLRTLVMTGKGLIPTSFNRITNNVSK